jgi:hypothetical protein
MMQILTAYSAPAELPPHREHIVSALPITIADDVRVEWISKEDQDRRDQMFEYVLHAMRDWNKGPMAGKATHLEEIAHDIVMTAIEEPKARPHSDGSFEAILLASIAWFEDRFRDYVDEGKCNEWMNEVYKKSGYLRPNTNVLTKEQQDLLSLGNCDGGHAATIWQVHFGTGITLLDDFDCWDDPNKSCRSWKYVEEGREGRAVVTKNDALANRQLGARVALAMARQSIRRGAGLVQFAGAGNEEKAKLRLDKAESYIAKHPFKFRSN